MTIGFMSTLTERSKPAWAARVSGMLSYFLIYKNNMFFDVSLILTRTERGGTIRAGRIQILNYIVSKMKANL